MKVKTDIITSRTTCDIIENVCQDFQKRMLSVLNIILWCHTESESPSWYWQYRFYDQRKNVQFTTNERLSRTM